MQVPFRAALRRAAPALHGSECLAGVSTPSSHKCLSCFLTAPWKEQYGTVSLKQLFTSKAEGEAVNTRVCVGCVMCSVKRFVFSASSSSFQAESWISRLAAWVFFPVLARFQVLLHAWSSLSGLVHLNIPRLAFIVSLAEELDPVVLFLSQWSCDVVRP